MNQYPGTNFHDLNLDWLLSEMKNCLAEWASTKEDWEELQTSNTDFKEFMTGQWEGFRDFVLNYLHNLPLTEEVSAKIDAMVEDGTLLNLITADEGDGSALSDVAGQWLNAHITQETGYVIDDTLTVTGAAADAKAAGDAINDLKGALNSSVVYHEPANLLHGTITNGYIIDSDGSINTRSEYSYSDYIKIDRRNGYIAFTRQATATTRTMDSMTTAFYDENKTFISRVGGNVKTIPNNAEYIRQNIVTSYLSNVYKPMIEYVNATGSNIAVTYSKWFESYYTLVGNYGADFNDKKICVYGDSLAANGNSGDDAWINIVGEKLQFKEVYNRGIGASRVTDTETRYAYVNSNGDAYNRSSYETPQTNIPVEYAEINPCMSLPERINTIPTDSDIIIILAGANDASGVTLDNIKTGYETMLNGIYTRCPNARIVLGTLLYNHNWDANDNQQIIDKYNNIRGIIKDLGAKYGYTVIDFKSNMGVNDQNYNDYMDSDGVHYTTKQIGKNRIAEIAIPVVHTIKFI